MRALQLLKRASRGASIHQPTNGCRATDTPWAKATWVPTDLNELQIWVKSKDVTRRLAHVIRMISYVISGKHPRSHWTQADLCCHGPTEGSNLQRVRLVH